MAGSGTSNTRVITPLDGSNYPTWKIQCQMGLMKDGLWGIVNESETRPGADDADGIERFDKKWDKALAIIVLSIDPTLLYMIGDPTSPVDVWKKLRDQFQRKTWANKLRLRRKLYSLKLSDGESIQMHIRIMTETFNELSVVGDAITDEDRVVHLLASLPDSYAVLVTALEACPEVPSWEAVTERLLHEERKLSEKEEYTDKAMAATRFGPRCYRCNEIGHLKRECPNVKERKPDKLSGNTGKGRSRKKNPESMCSRNKWN